MPTSLAVLHVFGGAAYLVMAGDLLVRGSVALARRLGISAVAVGLTVVALGTSAPELVVSVRAAVVGYPELAISNVVGSNIANVLLVLGLPAMIYPISAAHEGIGRDGVAMLLASLLFFGICFTGELGSLEGLVLLAGVAVFAAYVLRGSSLKRVWSAESEEMPLILGLPSTPVMIGVFIVLGGIGLPLGAELLIRGAVAIGDSLGVPNPVIGLTVVALGTSLPELSTTMVAAFQKEADLAVGNVLGSNVLNLLLIMGWVTVVSPEPVVVPARLMGLDLPVMLGAALVLTVLTLRKATVGRVTGAVFLAAYVVYISSLFGPGG